MNLEEERLYDYFIENYAQKIYREELEKMWGNIIKIRNKWYQRLFPYMNDKEREDAIEIADKRLEEMWKNRIKELKGK